MLPTPTRPPHAFRWLMLALVILVLLFLSMAMTAHPREASTAFENVVATVLHPFQAATSWVARQINEGVEFIRDMRTLRQENERLRAEVAELKHFRVLNQIVDQENRKLRAELDLRAEIPYEMLAAAVMARDPTNRFEDIVINRGTRDGVQKGMAVINRQGLVGTVIRTTLTTSTVQLLIDHDFAISAMTAPAGETGAVLWRGNQLLMEFPHNPAAVVQPGDAIVTSGLGERVPRNLPIGTIGSVCMRETNLVKCGTVQYSVDFSRLDFVQVVLSGPTAQQVPGSEQEGQAP